MMATIKLSPDDTLASLLARLETAPDRALFVVPKGLSLSAADLRVLRREAAARHLQIALLTSNARLRTLAAQEGISTFRSESWARRARWRGPRPDRPLPAPPIGTAVPAAPYGPGLYARRSPSGFRPYAFLRAFVRSPSSWWGMLGLLLLLVVLFVGVLAALAAVIPAATITITPASEPIEVTVPLRAVQDAATDVESGVVPARALSAQVSGEARIPTTGRRLEPDKKASGRVVVINRTSTPVNVPAGTIVSTATGSNVPFVTTAEAPLAPNGRATVPIEAVWAGPGSNVRAGTITHVEGPLALSLLVANDTPTSGGTMAQAAVVTEEDQQRLQDMLFEELKKQAFEKLNERLEPGSFIPPESVTYLAMSPTFIPFVGEVSPELFLSMTVQAVGLVVEARDGNDIALARLQSAMPPGTRLISDTVRFIPGSVAMGDPQTVEFSITADGTLLRGIDVGSVRTAIMGLDPVKASTVLMERFALSRPPKIARGPDWLPYIVPMNLPVLPWRIRVYVDWDMAARLAEGA